MSIGVAIIGSGIFVKEEHLPAVLATPLLTLKAVYSRSLKSASSLPLPSKDVSLYSDDSGVGNTYHDLLLRSDIQAVIIALPIMNQPEFIEAALAAGKHVLSEKPVAGDLEKAKTLIKFYETHGGGRSGVTWGVAENFRFYDSFTYGREQVERLGKVTGFRSKVFSTVKKGGKYFETEWRKSPTHQGGFLLDGGVHFTAGVRYLVGPSNPPVSLSSFTALLQPHLPPVDTINAIWLFKDGISGTFSVSFGTTLSGLEFVVACENGSVTVTDKKVIVVDGEEKDGKVFVKEFPNEGSGVVQEVKAWAKSIQQGAQNPLQSPQQALADLELLELMLTSGDAKGKLQVLEYQL